MVNTHWGPALVPTDSGGRVIITVRWQLTHNCKRICKEVTGRVNMKGWSSKTDLLLPRTLSPSLN